MNVAGQGSLTLSRRKGQSLVIVTDTGEKITVTLTALRDHLALIKITAPLRLPIYREEILARHATTGDNHD